MAKRMWDEKEIIEIAEEHGGEGGGAVKSVNGKTGAVVLAADDITANNLATVQSNLERIDSEINRVEAEIPDVSGLQEKLTAGANITIDENNVISASGGGSGSVEIDNWTIVRDYEGGPIRTSIGGAKGKETGTLLQNGTLHTSLVLHKVGKDAYEQDMADIYEGEERIGWWAMAFNLHGEEYPGEGPMIKLAGGWDSELGEPYYAVFTADDDGDMLRAWGWSQPFAVSSEAVNTKTLMYEKDVYEPIDAKAIPVDGATISNEGGVLEANIDNRTIVSEGGPIKSSIGGVYKSERTEAIDIADSITIRSGTNQYFYPSPQFIAWANAAQAGDALTVRMSKGWLQQEDYDAEVLIVSTNKLYLFIGEHDETGSPYFLRIRLDSISGDRYNLQAGANFFAEDTTILSLEIPEGEKTIIEPIKPEVIPVDGETIIVEDGMLKAVGGGGGEPNEYIKNASVSGNTLTLTNKDDTTVEFTPDSGTAETWTFTMTDGTVVNKQVVVK